MRFVHFTWASLIQSRTYKETKTCMVEPDEKISFAHQWSCLGLISSRNCYCCCITFLYYAFEFMLSCVVVELCCFWGRMWFDDIFFVFRVLIDSWFCNLKLKNMFRIIESNKRSEIEILKDAKRGWIRNSQSILIEILSYLIHISLFLKIFKLPFFS